MGERPKNAPPAVPSQGVVVDGQTALDEQSTSPGKFAENWPPLGWPMFACVTRPSGTVMGTDRDSKGNLPVLKYEVRIEAGVYTIEILQGMMGRSGQMGLQSALSIQFSGREDWYEERPEKGVHEITVAGKPLIPERGLLLRLILAMTFMISRIDRGLMPNLTKTLRIYRLDL
ncbi:MAG TPA: hypothetical protein VIN59_08310 [Alphaproteobacteria bacterium]